mgnify:CR=1 FL=1
MTQDMNQTRVIRAAWRAFLWGGLALLLLIPALAMQFEAEGVHWTASDFAIMGVLLAALGLGIEASVRRLRNWRSRLIAIGAALSVFLLIWVELAVGVFGTPFAGN